MIKSFLKQLDKPFYFGVGGIGDYLLLMSTFYDNCDGTEQVLFVANKPKTIVDIAKVFPKVQTYTLPRIADNINVETWYLVSEHPLCKGTGVTPKEFNYVEEWIKVGATNVFDYYKVNKHPEWASPLHRSNRCVVIQPFGGEDDKTKTKQMPRVVYNFIINEEKEKNSKVEIVIIGSEKEIQKLQIDSGNLVVVTTDFKKAFEYIRSCEAFYGADSWGKTLASMAGKQTLIYPNVYSRPPIELFGHEFDPGDYVFLKDWDLIQMVVKDTEDE